MRPYLFIGDPDDGLTHPAPVDAETLHWPSRIASRTTYHRLTLSLGYASIGIYVHESLTPTQALELLADFYKAWCVNQPGGRQPR